MNPWDPALDRATYVRRLLDSYRRTPTAAGRVRPADRRLAGQLYDRRVPLDTVQAAFYLAAARRIFRDFQAPPLAPIQSLHYFLPVLDEIRCRPINPEYLEYLAWKVQNADAELQRMREVIAGPNSHQILGE
jgi:hypothetical protein